MKPSLLIERRKIAASGAYKEELEADWHATDGPLVYSYKTGMLHPDSAKELSKRLETTDGTVRFLDAGAGHGRGIAEAELIDPKRIEGWGLSIVPPKEAGHSKQWVLDHVENVVFPGQFHVIQSYRMGAVHWSANHAIALENLLNSLTEHGTLVLPVRELKRQQEPIDVGMNRQYLDFYNRSDKAKRNELELDVPVLAWRRLFKTLLQQGFKINLKPDPESHRKVPILPTVIRIERVTKNADLREFYTHPAINRHTISPQDVS